MAVGVNVNKGILDIFREAADRIPEDSGIMSCVIRQISVNKDKRSVRVFMETESECSLGDVVLAEDILKKLYDFSSIEIYVNHSGSADKDHILGKDFEHIKNFLIYKNPSMIGVLKETGFEWENNVLKVYMPENCIDMVKRYGCFEALRNYLTNMLGNNYGLVLTRKFMTDEEIKEKNRIKEEIRCHVDEEMENRAAEYTASVHKEPEIREVSEILSKGAKSGKIVVGAEPVYVKKGAPRKRRSIEESRSAEITENGDAIIMGKDFIGEITELNDVNDNSGKIAVTGKIFSYDSRAIKDGGLLVSFEITDYTNSITVKFFASAEDEEYCKKQIKPGKWVRIYGEAQYDSFIREVSIKAQCIIEYKPPKEQDNAVEKRVELHLHTKMSNMDAVSDVSDLIKQAADWGHPAVAITDHGVVQAYPEAYKTVKSGKLDIKIIYGVECYLVNDDSVDNLEDFDYKAVPSYHCIILVKNFTGLKNLYKLISESYLNYFYKRPRMPKKLINKYREGLIIGSACEAGEIYKAVMNNSPNLMELCEFYDYFEIQPIGNNRFMVRNGMVKDDSELEDINRRITRLADSLGKLCVATCDVHFLKPRDEVYRRILMAGQGYSDADYQAPLYFRNTEDMLKEFQYLGENKAYEVVVTNTNKIAEMIDVIQPIPDGTFPPSLDNAEEDLRNMSIKKAKEIYGENLPPLVEKRLEKELNSIIKNGFAVMYMIAQKLVSKSNSDGYLVGSRGSVGSSFVANMAGITEVNSLPAHYICTHCKHSEFITDGSYDCGFDMPDKNCPDCGEPMKKDGYDIPFETFLGFDGDKAPDIDLNFSGDYQGRAHKYTEELFGEGYVFRAGTIATVADKTAYGFVKKYYENKGVNLRSAEINRITNGCTGVRRTTGQHPGGIMIVPKTKDIYDFSPIQHPADDPDSDIITTHFDYHFLHDSILKLDILGHDDPTVIRMLEDITGVDAKSIVIGEEKTMSLFSSTEALGVSPEDIDSKVGTFAIPEFGTAFVRQMLVDTMPKEFSELIRISGLSHGTDVWLNNAQELIRQGKCTLSEAICCRDDIMIYLIHKGLEPKISFKIMESVRKGKGLTQENIEMMKEHNVPDWYIESCMKIKYMFPKAHAAAYVMMAFRIAWFKVYYPEAFYATFFTVRADEFDVETCAMGVDRLKHTMSMIKEKGNDATAKEEGLYKILEVANEMYARGIEFLPVDLYKSDAKKFIIEDGRLRPPFNALQGLGTAAAEKIAAERDIAPFMSVEDFRNRTKVSKTIVDLLKKLGCLEGLTETDQLTLF